MAKTRVRINPEVIRRSEMQKKLAMNIAQLELSVRTTNCLEEHGITTVGELLKRQRKDLLDIPNFGEKTLEEVFNALLKIGFVRGEDRQSKSGYAPDEAERLLNQTEKPE